MVLVTVQYFASARQAANTSTEVIESATVADALRFAVATHGPQLGRIIEKASILVDGIQFDGAVVALREDVTVDVLPPFAGG